MKIYKYISTVKAKDPQGNKPTHYLKAKADVNEEGEFVASLWLKNSEKDGVKKNWLSGEMKSTYTDHTDSSKSREGYVIVNEKELNKVLNFLKKHEIVEEPEIEDIDSF